MHWESVLLRGGLFFLIRFMNGFTVPLYGRLSIKIISSAGRYKRSENHRNESRRCIFVQKNKLLSASLYS